MQSTDSRNTLLHGIPKSTVEELVNASLEGKPIYYSLTINNIRSMAYCPYSKFNVGAALLTADGKVYRGCNIESAAFGAGICAERSAIGAAVSNGDRKFKAIAVSSKSEEYCTPCGICRQLIREFGEDIIIILAKPDKTFDVTTIKDLLPRSFGPESLEK